MANAKGARVIQFAPANESVGALINSPYQLCAFLRGKLKDSKMPYKDLAIKTGLCKATISRMASGETKDPRTNTAISLLVALGCKLYIV